MSSAATKKTFLSGNDQIVEQISVMKLISTEKDPKISKEDCEQIAHRLSIDCQRVKVADIYMRESERPLKIVHRSYPNMINFTPIFRIFTF